LSEFETAFKAIYPDFFRNILQKHPELTPREVQICALIRLNLQTKQIAMITNNSPKSMEILRYRIRKKMGLLTDQSLSNELKNF
jgi:DNA-binding CsgD family transcriptional regulator